MSKKILSGFFLFLGMSIGLAGCGGGNFNGNYTGTWSGTFAGGIITNTTFNMTLYSSSSGLRGTWIASGATTPNSGTLTATQSGSTMAATFTVPTGATGQGSFTGTLSLSGTTLTGSAAGTNGATTAVNFSLTQQ